MSLRYSRAGIAKIIFLVILILALIIGGLIWLDFLGIIKMREQMAPITTLFGIEPRSTIEEPFSPTLLDEDRLSKERLAIAVERRALEAAVEELRLREAQIEQKESELRGKVLSLEEKQKYLNEALSQYDNKVANLEQTALNMMGMPPNEAVSIMNEYDVRDLVDLLRTSERLSREAGEESLVAYWLSIMPDKARAAEIQRLLVEKPGLDLDG